MCSRFYAWWKQNGTDRIGYWDILEENAEKLERLQMPQVSRSEITDRDVCLLVVPQYTDYLEHTSEEARNKNEIYIEKLKEYHIHNYTDYFSYIYKNIHLERNTEKYVKEELRPMGIVLGAIPARSGNNLVRQCLEGHPRIMMIQEGGFFNNHLYLICVRLAEERAENILPAFWKMYEGESGIEGDLFAEESKRNIFNRKMEELLGLGNNFTSQELFVMFHVAYEAMFGREAADLKNMVIYWEMHNYNRKWVRECAHWLSDKSVHGYTLATVRNRYMTAGSLIDNIRFHGEWSWVVAFGILCDMDLEVYYNREEYEYWDEFTVSFEDLKLHPKDEFTMICDKLGIAFHDSLLETTRHGKQPKNKGVSVSGFDLKPVYNLHEEYFSVFDRMRISLISAPYQKKYGYPYVSCLNFTRRELQEMFLKGWRWENSFPESTIGRDAMSMWNVNRGIRNQLWRIRFAEVMNVDIYSEYIL